MGDDDVAALRQQDGDAVAAPDAAAKQGVGKTVRSVADLAEADGRHRVVRADVQDGRPVWVDRGPAVADIDADVVPGGNRPAERRSQSLEIADGRQHGLRLVTPGEGETTPAALQHKVDKKWR
jgi:hypothetical protein